MREKQQINVFSGAEEPEPMLSEQAYRLLRGGILRGDIEPGQKLKVEVLQREYSFSSSPLREALNRLQAERLVVADERRGFRATPVSLSDFNDLTAFRLVIEEGALRVAMSRGTDEWEGGIVAAFHRLDAAEPGNAKAVNSGKSSWNERHKDFHLALLSGCGSTRLLSTCTAMFEQSERYRLLSFRHRQEPRDTLSEHRKMMEMVIGRQKKNALSLLRQHILQTAGNVNRILSEVARPATRLQDK